MAADRTDLLSLIVPTHGNLAPLRSLLESIKRQDAPGTEAIVVGDPGDRASQTLAEVYNARWLESRENRAVKRNLGAAAASGASLVFVDSDMELAPNAAVAFARYLGEWDALCIGERIPDGTYWSRARNIERRGAFGSLYFEASRGFRSSVFRDLGGYDPELVGLEDMDLQGALIRKGYRIGWLDNGLLHHEEALGFSAYLRKKTGRSVQKFSQKNPEYWRRLRSPFERSRIVMRGLISESEVRNATLVPGLAVLRLAELLVRER